MMLLKYTHEPKCACNIRDHEYGDQIIKAVIWGGPFTNASARISKEITGTFHKGSARGLLRLVKIRVSQSKSPVAAGLVRVNLQVENSGYFIISIHVYRKQRMRMCL